MKRDSTHDRVWAKGRRIGLTCTGIWCVGLGIGLIGTLVGTDMLGSTNTAALLMIVGVIMLPALTLAAIRQDRKVVGRVAGTQYAETKAFVDRGVVVHDRHERVQRHSTHTARSMHPESEQHNKVS